MSKGDILNLLYNNRKEKYCIFSSHLQLKWASNCDDFFLDATFKSASKNWIQLFNIWGYIRKHNEYVPIANILMSHKSYELYNKIFKEILYLFDSFNIEVNFEEKTFMSDYEKSLRAAIKNNKIRGCYFHYAKCIYKKCKDLNLFKKSAKNNTIIIAFFLKLFPYIFLKFQIMKLSKGRITFVKVFTKI